MAFLGTLGLVLAAGRTGAGEQARSASPATIGADVGQTAVPLTIDFTVTVQASQKWIDLSVIDTTGATISIPFDLAGNASSTRPIPKPRPRLASVERGPTANVDSHNDSPPVNIVNDYLMGFANRVIAACDETMRAEHRDWGSKIEVHCVLTVDPEKGSITVETLSSPSDPALVARFQEELEALEPARVPELLQAIVAKQLRLKLDFTNSKGPLLPVQPAK
jgi:hypothetical protein